MILKEFQDAFVLDKPAGIATHTPNAGETPGFTEIAAEILGQPLWAVHRLDRDTSGCLLVAKSARVVDIWTGILKKGRKKYVFVSPAESKEAVWSFEGRIEKTGNHKFSLVSGGANSFTKFAKLSMHPQGCLYEAEIETGKTHQIRLHAAASKIPVLGDVEYGGPPFSRLMLHSKELILSDTKIISALPEVFETSDKDPDVLKFLVSHDRRRFLLNQTRGDSNCFRLVHREWLKRNHADRLSVEKLDSVLQFLSYDQKDLNPGFIAKLCNYSASTHYLVRAMKDRGQVSEKSNIVTKSAHCPNTWIVSENKIQFELRSEQGLSSGLFLDQRDNRKKVLCSSQGLRVANFFSYTCGFSVAAALGGAHEVVSVDVSASYLEWGKQNFRLNNLEPDKYEFFVADSIFFLRACEKRNRKFNLIILDPPTFSRHKERRFQLAKDLPELLRIAIKILWEKGRILLTVNDENLTLEDLEREIQKNAREAKRTVSLEKIHPPYDFEFPTERDPVMKGFWLHFD